MSIINRDCLRKLFIHIIMYYVNKCRKQKNKTICMYLLRPLNVYIQFRDQDKFDKNYTEVQI